MKKLFTICFCFITFIYSSTETSAQNLVPNYGFEVQDTCPAVSEITLAQPWGSPTIGTPDLFNSTCGTQNSPARTGIGSSGIYCYSTFANNREYLQAPLTTSLVAGQTYCVSFYLTRSNFRYAMNRIGAYFSNGVVNQSTTSTLAFTPQVENPSSNMLSSTGWLLVSGSFVASGGETHILIGNFSNDADTDTLVVNAASSSKVAYYRIDDVSVTACVAGVEEDNNASDYINIFPLPASDIMSVRVENNIRISGYEVMNISGKVVKSEAITDKVNTTFSMDVSALAEGIYILSFETSSGRIIKRVNVIR